MAYAKWLKERFLEKWAEMQLLQLHPEYARQLFLFWASDFKYSINFYNPAAWCCENNQYNYNHQHQVEQGRGGDNYKNLDAFRAIPGAASYSSLAKAQLNALFVEDEQQLQRQEGWKSQGITAHLLQHRIVRKERQRGEVVRLAKEFLNWL